ncbi:hypothetical protein CRUP_018434 [Coryphaenoides rupestris]|nr:hypothetical protein CRUP_018434 [Coryphaenoides rupestris]
MQSYSRGWKARKLLRELKHQKRCEEAATIIAAFWHGAQARAELRRLKYVAACTRAVTLIWAYWQGTKARRELRQLKEEARSKQAVSVIWAGWQGAKARMELKRLKEEARRKHAVAVIWAYWLGLQVRREYRKFFRANAGRKIYDFVIQRIMQKYFLGLKRDTPSMSPCKKYRSRFTEEKKAVFAEKLQASEIFKDKKEGVEVLMADLQVPTEEFAYGRSKIFIRNPRTERRRGCLENLAALIQKIYRGWKCRTHFLLLKQSQVVVAAWYRRFAARKLLRELKHQKRCEEAATIIAAFWHGAQARAELRRLKYVAACTRAVTLIWAYWQGTKARMELKRLKEEARRKHAVAVIWAYWLGLQVRREYRKFFRANAGRKIYDFVIQRIMQKYFLGLKRDTPSMSPCKKYRSRFTEEKKAVFAEKLQASEIFKDKKSLYPSSVGQPFRGDYLEISKNPKYQKLSSSVEEKVLLADVVNKINRGNGKGAARIFLLTQKNFVLADQKTGQVKASVPLPDLTSISGSASAAKGDFLLSSEHLIEIITKLHRTGATAVNQEHLDINISDEFLVQFKHDKVCVKFVQGTPKNGNGVSCKRKNNRLLEVSVPSTA